MVERNPHFARVTPTYLFQEIRKRKDAFLAEHPDAALISLGIGDTTQPLGKHAVSALSEVSQALGTKEGYTGYGPEAGILPLRKLIAEKIYKGLVDADAIFISDGAKCDVGRLQILFGSHVRVAVQDPVYPVYVDTGLILGQQTIVTMPCTPENNFFPEELPDADIIFICSPNNPTGSALTRGQLQRAVDQARRMGAIIIYDAAYAQFIQDDALPRSIYEIEGADEVAIEIGSFSKCAGFTGVRLGWSVVPSALCYNDRRPLRPDWMRIVSTFFNGSSCLSQMAGCSVLSDSGLKEVNEMVAFYLENAKIIKNALLSRGLTVFGGDHVPYLFASQSGKSSWALFDALLSDHHLLTVPGSGFGPCGEGFVRLSAFGTREDASTAARRLQGVNDDVHKKRHAAANIPGAR